jgi:hypothetical protein
LPRAARPRLYRGPLCGGEMGSTGPEGGIGRTPIPFRQHTDVLSKSPAPAHGLAGHTCPASAKRGGLLFGLLFSWPSKRKVTRPPQEDETLCKRNSRSRECHSSRPRRWAPAFAGVTGMGQSRKNRTLTPALSERERGRSARLVLDAASLRANYATIRTQLNAAESR